MDTERTMLMFNADGCIREAHLPLEAPSGWIGVLRYVVEETSTWSYTVDGVSAALPSAPEEFFLCDGHARVFNWWIGGTELRTYFLDPMDFCFDFVPTGGAIPDSRGREPRCTDLQVARSESPDAVAAS